MSSTRCGVPLPFQPGPKLQGAKCDRLVDHRGPHCSDTGPSDSQVMWSDNGPIVSSDGGSLVSVADLTDADGRIWG